MKNYPYIEKPIRCGCKVSGSDISHNVRVKSYPDGSQEVLACERPVFGLQGWEELGREGLPSKTRRRKQQPDDGGSDRAVRRARAQVRDIALCTPFRFFVTLTLDGAKVDRYDIKAVTRKLNAWLDNQVRRRGLAYVLVPERHKDGAIHFHGFFNNALEAVDSGTISLPGSKRPRRPRSAPERRRWLEQGGHVVYNLPGWSLGFTTAIELYGEYAKAVSYVCKYIGKDQGEKIGGRWYYSGGELGRPEVAYTDLPVSELAALPDAYSFCPEGSFLGFVKIRLEPNLTLSGLSCAAAVPLRL